METPPLLHVQQVTKTYSNGTHSLTVLDDVSFSIMAGATCSIVGPSGSGKTTLLGLCAGLDRPSSGSVTLSGMRLNDLSEDELAAVRCRSVGFVFQTFQLIPTLTALENVMVPVELQGMTGFEANVRVAIQDQAKTLLGADFVMRSRQPFSSETEVLMRTLGGQQTREISFSSMVYFPKNDGTRLAQIRAINGTFPYYGRLETVPVSAAQRFQTGPYAIVDHTLMLQFDAQVGDAIKIGAFTFQILGTLRKAPGEAAAVSLAGPRVYISAHYLDQTELIQMGSRLRYKVYFKLAPGVDPARFREQHVSHFERHRLASETVRERASSIGQTLENLTQYLNLVGFIALLLGGVGVASGMQTYIKHKLSTVATLRCVGAQARQTFAVYVIQAGCLSVVGIVVGAFLGVVVQIILPHIMQDFLPVRIAFFVAWEAIAQGMAVGLGIALLFALLPLVSVRTVSPLHAP